MEYSEDEIIFFNYADGKYPFVTLHKCLAPGSYPSSFYIDFGQLQQKSATYATIRNIRKHGQMVRQNNNISNLSNHSSANALPPPPPTLSRPVYNYLPPLQASASPPMQQGNLSGSNRNAEEVMLNKIMLEAEVGAIVSVTEFGQNPSPVSSTAPQLPVRKGRGKSKSKLGVSSEVSSEKPSSSSSLSSQPVTPEKLEECGVCLDLFDSTSRLSFRLSRCGPHYFHEQCIRKSLEYNGKCPVCQKLYIFAIGTQPENGTMNSVVFPPWQMVLPGYESYGTIQIHYSFQRGVQTAIHPNPGVPYSGDYCERLGKSSDVCIVRRIRWKLC